MARQPKKPYAVEQVSQHGVLGWFREQDHAETFAREQCRISGNAYRVLGGAQVVACVRMDAAGRVWTDVGAMEGGLL